MAPRGKRKKRCRKLSAYAAASWPRSIGGLRADDRQALCRVTQNDRNPRTTVVAGAAELSKAFNDAPVRLLRFSGWRDAKLFGDERATPLVNSESLSGVARRRMGPHQASISRFPERLCRDRLPGSFGGGRRLSVEPVDRRPSLQCTDEGVLELLSTSLDPRGIAARKKGPCADRPGHRGRSISASEIALFQSGFRFVNAVEGDLVVDPGRGREV
jgi:hypothetical protein